MYVEPFEESQSWVTDEVAGKVYTTPTSFEPSNFNDESESSTGAQYLHTETSNFGLHIYPVQESETSADELALDSYATPTKRPHIDTRGKTPKVLRHSYRKSGGKRR